MPALVLTADGPVVRAVAPSPVETEAHIRLEVGGICATDLELVKGYMGFTGVLGHEWVGVVERVPPGQEAWIGRRVVGDINCPCRTCETCRAGRPTHCPHRTVLGIQGRDGAFADHFNLPVANLHAVPDGVSDDAAVFVEPLAAACEIVEQVHVRPTDYVIVLGLGRLGQLCARVLALTGAHVVGITRSASRRALLPASVEARDVEQVRRGPRADLVVDCTGSPKGIELATVLVRPRGTIVLKTTLHDAPRQSTTPWVIDEITLVGSRCGPFDAALRLLAANAVNPTPLISARYALADGVSALADAAKPDVVKVLLTPT